MGHVKKPKLSQPQTRLANLKLKQKHKNYKCYNNLLTNTSVQPYLLAGYTVCRYVCLANEDSRTVCRYKFVWLMRTRACFGLSDGSCPSLLHGLIGIFILDI